MPGNPSVPKVWYFYKTLIAMSEWPTSASSLQVDVSIHYKQEHLFVTIRFHIIVETWYILVYNIG